MTTLINSRVEWNLFRREAELNPEKGYIAFLEIENENWDSPVVAPENVKIRLVANHASITFSDCKNIIISSTNDAVLRFHRCGVTSHYLNASDISNTKIYLFDCKGTFRELDSSNCINAEASLIEAYSCICSMYITYSSLRARDCLRVILSYCKKVLMQGESYFFIKGISDETEIKAYGQSIGKIQCDVRTSATWLQLYDFSEAFIEFSKVNLSGIVCHGAARLCSLVNQDSNLESNSIKTVYLSKDNKYYKAVSTYTDANGVKHYSSFYDPDFSYVIGEEAYPNSFDCDPSWCCSSGIHIGSLDWVLSYGCDRCAALEELAILEVEPINPSSIIVGDYSDGKLRCDGVKVLREVPVEEWGFWNEGKYWLFKGPKIYF